MQGLLLRRLNVLPSHGDPLCTLCLYSNVTLCEFNKLDQHIVP